MKKEKSQEAAEMARIDAVSDISHCSPFMILIDMAGGGGSVRPRCSQRRSTTIIPGLVLRLPSSLLFHGQSS